MNLITNSCVNGILLRDYYKKKYNNPFVWCEIDTESIYNLIKDYNNINWLNYDLHKDDKWNFSILIDDKVKIDYVHYKFDKKADKQYKKVNNIYSNKIWKYICEKYETRVKRMIELNEKPIFILGNMRENEWFKYDKNFLEKIDNLDTPYDVMLFSNLYKFNKKPSFNYNENIKSNFDLTQFIWENYLCQK